MECPGSESSSWHPWRLGGCWWSIRGFKRLAQGHMASLRVRAGDPSPQSLVCSSQRLLDGSCSPWQGPWSHLHLLPVGQQQGLGAAHCLGSLQKQSNITHHGCSSRFPRQLWMRDWAGGPSWSASGGMGQRVTHESWEGGQGLARGCCAQQWAWGCQQTASSMSRFLGSAESPGRSQPSLCAAAVQAWGSAPTHFHVISLGLKPTTFISAREIKWWLFDGT